MQSPDFKRSINVAITEALRDVHTIKPAVVTSVNGDRVNAKPLTKTAWKDGTQLGCTELFDVPLFVYSANKGKAKMTVPVKEGDPVLILMSDRDYGPLLSRPAKKAEYVSDDITPLGLNPIAALPCFFTEPDSVSVNTEDIVVENEGSTVNISPAGDISIHSEGNYKVEASEKLALGQEDGDELLDLMSQLMEKLIAATTPTIFGPQNLSIAASELPNLKEKLDAIKGSL